MSDSHKMSTEKCRTISMPRVGREPAVPALSVQDCVAIEIGRKVTTATEHSHWESHSRSAFQQIPLLLWYSKFITVFTTAHHWALPWTRWIQSTPSNSPSLRPILILTSDLRTGLPTGPFTLRSPIKFSMHFSSLTCALHTAPILSFFIWST